MLAYIKESAISQHFSPFSVGYKCVVYIYLLTVTRLDDTVSGRAILTLLLVTLLLPASRMLDSALYIWLINKHISYRTD